MISGQWLSKHIPAAMNMHAMIRVTVEDGILYLVCDEML
jgi:hypothetical protein